MHGDDMLAERFEANRSRLRAVAYRMLGSAAEADDAVQESWLRLQRTDAGGIDNVTAWLTTVVGRVCLDTLRTRAHRREDPLEIRPAAVAGDGVGPAVGTGGDPEEQAVLADSVGLALLVVLETLSPVERLAFVLHDMFAIPFDEIAPIVGRSPAATRQIASRARRRIQAGAPTPDADASRQRKVVDAFLAAARGGEFETLITLLDPDVVMRVDAVGAAMGGSPGEVRGQSAVASFFSGRASTAAPALVDGGPGFAVVLGGRTAVAIGLVIAGGRIVALDAVADPQTLHEMEVELLSP